MQLLAKMKGAETPHILSNKEPRGIRTVWGKAKKKGRDSITKWYYPRNREEMARKIKGSLLQRAEHYKKRDVLRPAP